MTGHLITLLYECHTLLLLIRRMFVKYTAPIEECALCTQKIKESAET